MSENPFSKNFSSKPLKGGFMPIVKFVNFGDYIIGEFIKFEEHIDFGLQLIIKITDSNIKLINVTAKNPNGESVKSLKNIIVKISLNKDVEIKLTNEIDTNGLISDNAIIGIHLLGESKTVIRKGNAMKEYDVRVER